MKMNQRQRIIDYIRQFGLQWLRNNTAGNKNKRIKRARLWVWNKMGKQQK